QDLVGGGPERRGDDVAEEVGGRDVQRAVGRVRVGGDGVERPDGLDRHAVPEGHAVAADGAGDPPVDAVGVEHVPAAQVGEVAGEAVPGDHVEPVPAGGAPEGREVLLQPPAGRL